MTETTDFLVIGGGVVGLTLALEARRRHPDCSVTVLEKESACGAHGSTRNSGVLHAGFYYTADSLKAKLTVEGNRRLTEYCLERDLAIRRCGKLVVARNSDELETLDELYDRGRVNGVDLERITDTEARAIEPRVRTHQRALFSPTTSSVDPRQVMEAFVRDCSAHGIRILTETPYVGRRGNDVLTPHATVSPGYVINAAGLYADRVARDFGVGSRYAILPFKGVFACAADHVPPLNAHVYPVPNLANPFLGVHFTVTVGGQVMIGPSAIPAFWREHYGGFRNFRLRELIEIAAREARLFVGNDFGFRSLALREMRKYSRRHLVGLASTLLRDVRVDDFPTWGPAGIRAQLLDLEERRLVMDFCFEQTGDSLHVLNAVSPAFTCCLSFAEHLFDTIEGDGTPGEGTGS